MTEYVSLGTDVDIAEEGECADDAILVHGIVRHLRVPHADCLALDPTEVNTLLLRVALNDLDGGETVNSEKIGVWGMIPGAASESEAALGIELVDGPVARERRGHWIRGEAPST